jgi:hypothetical protein
MVMRNEDSDTREIGQSVPMIGQERGGGRLKGVRHGRILNPAGKKSPGTTGAKRGGGCQPHQYGRATNIPCPDTRWLEHPDRIRHETRFARHH